MPQVVFRETRTGSVEELYLPDAHTLVMPGVIWGHAGQLFTPAYWAAQAWLSPDSSETTSFRLGETIQEEIAACVLGGYGMPAELGLAAFSRLRQLGLFEGTPSETDLYTALSTPFLINGRSRHYRFIKQRSRTLSAVLYGIAEGGFPDLDQRACRNWLLQFPGIGLKTASWITRNWFASNVVAVLDVHIYRAGVIAGVFRHSDSVIKDYLSMEARFLGFAQQINVPPSLLDGIMWQHMRDAGHIAHSLFRRCVFL